MICSALAVITFLLGPELYQFRNIEVLSKQKRKPKLQSIQGYNFDIFSLGLCAHFHLKKKVNKYE